MNVPTRFAALVLSVISVTAVEALPALAHEGSHIDGYRTAAASRGRAVHPGPVPEAECGPGSNPETGAQGRVSLEDHESGRAAKGYTCNTELVGRFGPTGGYKVHRYVDSAGRECGYYDTTLLFPFNVPRAGANLLGTYALDMSNSSRPLRTASLMTPAMLTPHESLSISPQRGLLGAVMGNPTTYPGFIDLYDISQDCRNPVVRSSLPLGILGHEGNFSPDGKTFYSASTSSTVMTAIDVSNPLVPRLLWRGDRFRSHGMNISDDGNRLYMANLGNAGLTILDVSEIQARKSDPQVGLVSHLTWENVSIPQNAIPITVKGHPFVLEFDEFSSSTFSYDPDDPVGAARIIDIADEKNPKVVSNIRLEVNEPEARAGDQQNDPGATNGLQGYAAHYCAVPQRDDPGIAACSFILSGLRIFDIRNPYRPKELAYFNPPPQANLTFNRPTSYAMSAPTFVPERSEIWFSDGNSGFYAVRVTNGVWPFAIEEEELTGTQLTAATLSPTPALALLAAGLAALVGMFSLVNWIRIRPTG